MSGITAAAAAEAGGCQGLGARPQPRQEKPGWRGSPGTRPSSPPPMLTPPLLPQASRARAPVLLRLLPPVPTEHTQPPPVWTHLARAFCKRWYFPDCPAPLLSPSPSSASLPSSLPPPSFSSTFLWPLFPLPSFLIHPILTVYPSPRHCAVFVNIGRGKSRKKSC